MARLSGKAKPAQGRLGVRIGRIVARKSALRLDLDKEYLPQRQHRLRQQRLFARRLGWRQRLAFAVDQLVECLEQRLCTAGIGFRSLVFATDDKSRHTADFVLRHGLLVAPDLVFDAERTVGCGEFSLVDTLFGNPLGSRVLVVSLDIFLLGRIFYLIAKPLA
jgi:hypothetical protein